MTNSRKRKPAKRAVTQQPESVIQLMPGGRCRIDPSIVGDLTCWLLCIHAYYDKIARQTWSGMKGTERSARIAHIQYGKNMRLAVQHLIDSLTRTQDVDTFMRNRQEWTKVVENFQTEV